MPSSESGDSAAEIVKTKSVKKQKSSKTKHRKNEGRDSNWAFQPPSGSSLLDHSADHAEFDWDAIKQDEDTELWVIRIPENVKPKNLQNFVIDSLPSQSSQTAKIASHVRKHHTYELYNLGTGDDEELSVGGEELRRLNCLLPKKGKKGKLFRAPKPISRQLVMRLAPPSADLLLHETIPQQNAPRQAYPPELLTHHFIPYGSLAPQDEMAVDDTCAEERPPTPDVTARSGHKESQKRKGGDNESSTTQQKTKKAKRNAV